MLGAGLLSAVALWAVDLLVGQVAEPVHALASLFFLVVVLIPGSLLAALFLRVVVGPGNPFGLLVEHVVGVARRLWKRDFEGGFRFLLGGIGLALWLGLSALTAFYTCRYIAQEVVQARFQAILSVASTVAAFVLLLPVLLFVAGLGRVGAGAASRIPVLRQLWSRRVYPLLLAVAIVGAAGGWFLWKFREAVRLSPWQTPAALVATLLAGLVAGGLLAFWLNRPRVAFVFSVTLLSIVVLASSGAVLLAQRDPHARQFFQRTLGTRLAWKVTVKLLDRDHDGYMHAFAGGDCAPDDKGISPAALDVPGNGIDEDCDGEDVTRATLRQGRWDYRLPEPLGSKRLPVFLITDDALAAGHVGFMGYRRDITPNIDALSRECVRFDKAFSQGPSTRLSFGALFTGLFDTQIKLGESLKVPHPLLAENHTLAEAFQQAGYETVAVVPNAYFTSRWKGLLQGFDKVDSSGARTRGREGPKVHNARQVTDAAVAQVRKKRTKPLFLWVHYYDNHPPFAQPEDSTVFGTSRADQYDAEVESVDRNLKPLLDAIKAANKRDGYILIFTSDHGSTFDKAHAKHTHGYDLHTSTVHVPLLVCSRYIRPLQVKDTPVSLLDLFPTLANLVALPVEAQFEGTSLVPLLLGQGEWPDRQVFHQFYLKEKIDQGTEPLLGVAVRNGRFNYIWDRREDLYSLYDWVEDPGERTDLIESHSTVARELDSVLKTWLMKVYQKGKAEGGSSQEEEGGSYDDPSLQY